LIQSISDLQRSICAYGSHATVCDCKYGFSKKDVGNLASEKTCCPELRSVVEMLQRMNNEEYMKFCGYPEKMEKKLLRTINRVSKGTMSPERAVKQLIGHSSAKL
jgi:23S rRNA A2030 N6-methylase RlmJ